jgi:hypothetical protein
VPANLKFDDVRPVYAKLPDYKDGFALVQGGDFLPKVSRKIDIFQERMAK